MFKMKTPGFTAETSLYIARPEWGCVAARNDPDRRATMAIVPSFEFECALLGCPVTHPTPPPGKICIINGCYPTGFGWWTVRVRCLYLCFPWYFW
jgi:hypothetical protein